MAGSWQARIYNECGEAWSNVCNVKMGYPDIFICENVDTVFTVDEAELSSDERYKWEFNDNEIPFDNIKSDKNKVIVSNSLSENMGQYICYIVNDETNEKRKHATVYLRVNTGPEILKNLPEESYSTEHGYFDLLNINLKFYDRTIYYEILRDDELFEKGTLYKQAAEIFNVVSSLINLGGFYYLPGTYTLRIYNECYDMVISECKFILTTVKG